MILRNRSVLGPLQMQVMRVLWARGKRASVKFVWEELHAQHQGRAYTTIMTTMQRLYEAGVLERRKKGLAYLYWPAVSEAELIGIATQTFLRGLEDWHGEVALAVLRAYLAEAEQDQAVIGGGISQ